MSDRYIQDSCTPIGRLCFKESSELPDHGEKTYPDFAVGNLEANSAVHVDIDNFRVLNWLFGLFGTGTERIPNPQ